jgi:hypothetical protein
MLAAKFNTLLHRCFIIGAAGGPSRSWSSA